LHSDADDSNDTVVFKNKIPPSLTAIAIEDETVCCKIIVPVIPVRMTESWMLADKELFKNEIGTNKSDNELGINRFPENIARPKEVIRDAIRISRRDMVQRRRR
jgi:hypothetical protein